MHLSLNVLHGLNRAGRRHRLHVVHHLRLHHHHVVVRLHHHHVVVRLHHHLWLAISSKVVHRNPLVHIIIPHIVGRGGGGAYCLHGSNNNRFLLIAAAARNDSSDNDN